MKRVELSKVQFLDSATAIAKSYPSVIDQLRYKKLIEAVRAMKERTPEISRAEIETQVALADAIDDGLESGEVRAEGDGKYQVGTSALPKAEVHRWRKLRAIPDDDRQAYYSEQKRPSRNGLLSWWSDKCVDGSTTKGKSTAEPSLVELVGELRQSAREMTAEWPERWRVHLCDVAIAEFSDAKEPSDGGS